MKRIGIVIISAVCIIAVNTARADEDETIFKSQECMTCQKIESTSKVKTILEFIGSKLDGLLPK